MTREIKRPYLEKKDLARVGFDPACKHCNAQKAKWSIEWAYVDWGGLEALREQPDYDIPSQQVLLDWFFRDKKAAQADSPVMTIPESMRAYLTHAMPTNFQTNADPLRANLVILSAPGRKRDCGGALPRQRLHPDS